MRAVVTIECEVDGAGRFSGPRVTAVSVHRDGGANPTPPPHEALDALDRALGIAVNASADTLEGWIDRFATDAPAVFGVKPSSHQPTQKRNNR